MLKYLLQLRHLLKRIAMTVRTIVSTMPATRKRAPKVIRAMCHSSRLDCVQTVRIRKKKVRCGYNSISLCQFYHCKKLINPKKVLLVSLWVHPGPGGGPPPFARV